MAEAVALALEGGVDWVQLREKAAPALEVYEEARELLAEAVRRGKGLLINDRVDVALAVGAQGVHLARKSLPPAVVRRLLGPKRLVGVSVHSLDEARAAESAGADYVTFGHVFATSSKPGLPPRGLDELSAVVEGVDIPVLAIGGIHPRNVRAVLETGCAGVAVISAILQAPDPRAAAMAMRAALDAVPTRPRRPLVLPAGEGEMECG